jgi:hypothetical protein
MLTQRGMLTSLAFTSTPKRTRSNCAMAISQRRIAGEVTLASSSKAPQAASHGGKLKRAESHVNGYVLIHVVGIRDRGLTTAGTPTPEGHPMNPSDCATQLASPSRSYPLGGTGPAPWKLA